MSDQQLHHIVIVGGGAGGLELATKLGNSLGRKAKAQITLIDKSKTHVWKPLLHEIAAGSMNPERHELVYFAQAHWHHFNFRLGSMDRLDRSKKELSVAPNYDEEGIEVIPRRHFNYDTLIMAVGSTSNDFGIAGARTYATALDTQDQAEKLHRRIHNSLIRAQTQSEPVRAGQLQVAIIGAGATGIELAAELHNTTRELAAFGLDKIDPDKDIKICLIEASEHLLPALPNKVADSVRAELDKLNIQLYMGERVTEVTEQGVSTASGRFIASELVVWAAGIKAPDFLRNLDDLEVNNINQLMVNTTLQTTRDEAIFAFGDCSSCPWPGHPERSVPPRAQAAHQQASLLVKSIKLRIADQYPLPEYSYRDYGSLVNLGTYSTVGSLMGALSGGRLFIEGSIAHLMYESLYKLHLMAVHGFWSTALLTLARMITRRTEARVKLH
ncbi:MAG: NAD(P)/FAD-dependent oxidoreductase [Candidatus Thioglobus sp.]|nr:MAG: NAD(P)/FAD-dependent oxidoreductase [Candidatus Thioglobus sp.]|tara:strand:- start:13 stop:1338 length:1326 start_codon:yes stop_codon:yes gene_type:complete